MVIVTIEYGWCIDRVLTVYEKSTPTSSTEKNRGTIKIKQRRFIP
jgi:hypothetical protein